MIKRLKQSIRMLGYKNPNWREKTNAIFATGRHRWLKRRIPKPLFCEFCNKAKPYDLANKSQKYKYQDLSDWLWLCRKCHIKQDGRLETLKIARQKPRSPNTGRKISLGLKGKMVGNKHWNWQGGKPVCLGCKIKLSDWRARRCHSCEMKRRFLEKSNAFTEK